MSNIGIPQGIKDGFSNVSKTVSEGLTTAEQTITSGVQNVSNTVQQFGSQASTSISNAEFLDTNSIIAKTVFILLLLVVFMILLKSFTALIVYLSSPRNNPYIVYGMLDGGTNYKASRNPNDKDYLALPRSNNQNSGIEFTWTFWVVFNKVNQPAGAPNYMHVFHVGNPDFVANGAKSGLASINNGPGVYLTQVNSESDTTSTGGGSDKGYMNMHIVMDTEFAGDDGQSNTYIDVPNLPYEKWVHVAIRVQNMSMDVYINGTVTQRVVFDNTPKQNYGDIYVCQNGGFYGFLSNLQYHAHALNVFDINSQVMWGPNTKAAKVAGNSTNKLSNYDYISSSWFFNKMGPNVMNF